MEGFIQTAPAALGGNAIEMISKGWMLITSGDDRKNTMTASWGGIGFMWNKPVTFCVVRPQRFTFQTMEACDRYTLSFFEPGAFRDQLNYLGSASGYTCDKIATSGLTPIEVGDGCLGFAEASVIMTMRKLYFQDVNPANFIDPAIDRNYPGKDYHRMYVGEITGCYAKK